jgi:ubiquinone/menaquinone biosynthesis C-methylase UbiE
MSLVSNLGIFDDIALTYDDTIDWTSRLEREMPFLLDGLRNPTGKRVLDLACGTGRHSIEFASKGASVIGIDISKTMLNRARTLAEARGVQPEFIESDMLNLDKATSGRFDLVLCLGNSLSLVETFEDQKRLLSRIYDSLEDEGIFIAQVLNFEEIRKSMFRFFPLKVGTSEMGHLVTFLKFFEHKSNSTSDLFFVSFVLVEDSWHAQTSVQRVLNMSEQKLGETLADLGFSKIEILAGYDKALFRPSESRNILVRAYK